MKLILLTKKKCLNVFLIFFVLLGINEKAVTKTWLSGTTWLTSNWILERTEFAGDNLFF